MPSEWPEQLANEFEWPDDEPGPRTVSEEAKEQDIPSISYLIEHMNDAPEQSDTGYSKWKWFKNYKEAFTG